MPPNITVNNKRTKKRMIITIIMAVVVVIIIAVVVVIGLYSWRRNTVISQFKSDLNKVASVMKSSRDKFGAYPVTIPSASNKNIELSGGSSFDGTTYCITGTSASDKSIVFHIDPSNFDNPQSGTCATGSDVSVPLAPGNLAIAFAAVSSIKLTWDITPYTTNYTLQCATGDKFTDNVSTVKVAGTMGMCEKLNASTTYYCRVRASNKAGDGAWSVLAKITTLAG